MNIDIATTATPFYIEFSKHCHILLTVCNQTISITHLERSLILLYLLINEYIISSKLGHKRVTSQACQLFGQIQDILCNLKINSEVKCNYQNIARL